MSTPGSPSTYSQPGFRKKLVYGMMIVVLFGIMFPYTERLAAVKKERDLGEAAIGQIDTGSFMMKLFLLGGFRGIVADYLWNRAEDYKREHDWDRLAQTVDMITKLQPHFLAIWTYQSWNLAYNVAVEWDAPEDKYQWIKKGIQFVQQGVDKNRRSPDLVWDTAWYYYHKIGFSDESIILRRLFRDDTDEDFKRYYDPELKTEVVGDDNFKLGYGWFSRSVQLVDSGANRLLGGTSDTIQYVDPTPQRKGRPDDIAFRSMPAHGQTRYAVALEKMSTYGIPARFGEKAKNEWASALNEWVKFGEHTYMSHNEIVDPATGKTHRDPIQIDDASNPAKLATLTENQKYWSQRWADQMNYRYWKERCQAEQTDEAVRARELFYQGTVAYKTGDFPKAVARYKEGLQFWKQALNEHPTFRDDDLCKKDTGLIIKRYARALQQADEKMPDDTPFKDTLVLAQNDPTVDPFDAIEMIGVPGGTSTESSDSAEKIAVPTAPPGSGPTR
jgi:hypothetical protein